MKKQKIKCLDPKCKLPAAVRGICTPHYNAAFRLVRSGRTTWAELVANGKCLEKTANKSGSRTDWLMEVPK